MQLSNRALNIQASPIRKLVPLSNAAKAAGIQAIDSVFSDVSDMEALKQNVLESKSLGFDGMGLYSSSSDKNNP